MVVMWAVLRNAGSIPIKAEATAIASGKSGSASIGALTFFNSNSL